MLFDHGHGLHLVLPQVPGGAYPGSAGSEHGQTLRLISS
jgi:hypothetical protein